MQKGPCAPDVPKRGDVYPSECGAQPLTAAGLERADVLQPQCSRIGERGAAVATGAIFGLENGTTCAAIARESAIRAAIRTRLEGIERFQESRECIQIAADATFGITEGLAASTGIEG